MEFVLKGELLMMKRFVSVFLAVVLLLNVPITTFATETESASGENYYICYSKDGQILSYNMPVTITNTARAEDGTYLKSTQIGTGSVSMVDLGYHPSTTIWRYVASYSFSYSTTVGVSVSLTWGGETFNGTIGISASSSSFGYTINADRSRPSKIRVYCGYDYVIYQGEVRSSTTDELLYTFNYATFTKTTEEFRVVYND